METIGFCWDWKRDRYGKVRFKSKKMISMVQIKDPEKVFYEKEIYYVRPDNTGFHYYLISGGFSRKCPYEMIKSQVLRGDIYVQATKAY